MDDKEKGNLAIGKAHEPQEDAYQPLTKSMVSSQNKEKKQILAFAENESPDSQTSQKHRAALSQPAPGLSHLQKLLWLQNRRTTGLWAQCDDCDRWRYLADVLDRHELPAKWFCRMNPDKSVAECSAEETELLLRDEEELIHSAYAAGSLVWARLPARPPWPALVDDCPDTEQYYWLDGFSDIPTHYNVTFFDRCDVTRAWVDAARLEPYAKNKNLLKSSLRSKIYRKRLEVAISQADDAEKLTLADRLKKYSFISRYQGSILKPKKMSPKFYERFRRQFKRRYNIELPNELSDSDEEASDTEGKQSNADKNVTTLGSKRNKLSEVNNDKNKDIGFIDKCSSLIAEIDTKSAIIKEWLTNGTSSTNAPDTNEQTNTIQNTQEIENRPRSPASDDFDF